MPSAKNLHTVFHQKDPAELMPSLASMRHALADRLCGNRVVFHHTPKCGGTSVQRALRMRYAISYATFDLDPIYSAVQSLNPEEKEPFISNRTADFRELQLLTFLNQDIRCISGHVYFSDAAYKNFSNRYKFITTLRDPVDFFISFFYQLKFAKEERWRIDCSLAQFIETPQAELIGKFFLLYFSGEKYEEQEATPEIIKKTKSNLEKFDVVGLLDDIESFRSKITEILGVKLNIGHANKSTSRMTDKNDDITPEIRRTIERLSAPNIEIYNFIKFEINK